VTPTWAALSSSSLSLKEQKLRGDKTKQVGKTKAFLSYRDIHENFPWQKGWSSRNPVQKNTAEVKKAPNQGRSQIFLMV